MIDEYIGPTCSFCKSFKIDNVVELKGHCERYDIPIRSTTRACTSIEKIERNWSIMDKKRNENQHCATCALGEVCKYKEIIDQQYDEVSSLRHALSTAIRTELVITCEYWEIENKEGEEKEIE